MALITCPHCGKQISDTQEKCIHCGYELKVCPECKKVLADGENQCPNCGYEFSGNITPAVREEIDGGSSETADYDLLKVWQKSMPNDKKILTGFKYLDVIIHVAAVVFIAICFILISKWKNISDPLEKLSRVKELKSGCLALIAIACILEIVLEPFGYIKAAFVKIRCSNWIGKQEFDCVAYINEAIRKRGRDKIKSSEIEDMGLFTESAYISENPSAKTQIYIGGAIRVIGEILLMVCLGVFASQTLDEYIIEVLYSSEFDFKYTSLIAAAVILVIYFVALAVSNRAYRKKYEAWEKKNITAYKELKQTK